MNHSVAWDLGKVKGAKWRQGPTLRQKVCLEPAPGSEEKAGEETFIQKKNNSRFCFQRPFVTQVIDH